MWKTVTEKKKVKANRMRATSTRLKERYGAMHSEANKWVKMSARTDKRLYVDNVAAETERGAIHQG